jgi:hypothetical protein
MNALRQTLSKRPITSILIVSLALAPYAAFHQSTLTDTSAKKPTTARSMHIESIPMCKPNGILAKACSLERMAAH